MLQDKTQIFISKAGLKHGDAYSYEKVDYKTARAKVIISCCRCGIDFSMTPDSHLCGSGCRSCSSKRRGKSQRKSLECFIAESKLIHKEKYDYSFVEYVNAGTKVKIYCKQHRSIFEQSPSKHRTGNGCPLCMKNGYNKNKFGSFYTLKAGNIFKVGITNRRVCTRVKEINRSSGLNFEVVTNAMFMVSRNPAKIEEEVIDLLNNICKPVLDKFDGSTECYVADESFNDVLALINKIINKHDMRVYV